MARTTYRDLNCPDRAHKVRVNGVTLQFGSDGLLSDPRADQVAVMEADPYLRQRFVTGSPRSPKQSEGAEKPAVGNGATPAPGPAAGANPEPDKATEKGK